MGGKMKLLILAPYSYFQGIKGFEKNKSGLAYMIGDIATAIANQNIDVSILTQSGITGGTSYQKMNIIKREWKDIFIHIRFQYIKLALPILKNKEISNINRLKCLLYFLSGGYIEHVIKMIKPDVVQIHTIGYYSIPFINACINCNVPYVITLHGLISLSESIKTDTKQKDMEQSFCRLAGERDIPITVISTGVRNRIIDSFNVNNYDNIKVILNGIKSVKTEPIPEMTDDIRTRYGILMDKKVFICVSGITERKNQMQVVRAFNLFDNYYKQQAILLFLGGGELEEKLKNEILHLKLENRIFSCGFIPREEMCNFYSVADYNITASTDEGFGLPIIEAFQYGIPTVMFADLDAAYDLYSETSMILVHERNDLALAKGMQKAMDNEWDKNKIISHSEQFSINKIANDYISILDDKILSHATNSDIDLLMNE
jgi:glycosyltransferase involved in cell wall biosynthesis